MEGKFWKSVPKAKKEMIKLYIPEENIEEVLALLDAYEALPHKQDRVAYYRVWKTIYLLFDIPLNTTDRYDFNSNGIQPYIARKVTSK